MKAIEKVISLAKDEIGYLEKASNSNLDSKTGNAGYNNYTKYWRDIKPSYQGQPWCACFVTWIFEKAFGKDNATKLLKHYPYVYCPTMANLFTLNANPKVGDIVIFKHGSEFTHTGIVIYVNGDYFETIEGNTSAGSTIVPNGGGVYKKSYYNSNLPGTKFCTPNYAIVEGSTNTSTTTNNTDSVYEKAAVYNKARCKELQHLLNQCGYNAGTEDNIYGPNTHAALGKFQAANGLEVDYLAGPNTFATLNTLIKKPTNTVIGDQWVERLQTECNRQGYSNQVVDGIPGSNTLAGCPMLRQGAQGNITKLVQERLNALGYNTNGIDGIFGSGTYNAVVKYQKDNGLGADGIIGRNTWKRLLGL